MELFDLTPAQLRRVAAIKEKLDSLNRELSSLLNGSSPNGAASGKKRTMSAAAKRKFATAQRAGWRRLSEVGVLEAVAVVAFHRI